MSCVAAIGVAVASLFVEFGLGFGDCIVLFGFIYCRLFELVELYLLTCLVLGLRMFLLVCLNVLV